MQTQPWLPYRTVYPPPEHTACDDLRVFSGLSAPHSSPRDILVLVPPTGGEGDRRFPVLYMQDGRSLFDPGTSLAGSWKVGETMEALRTEGLEAIVVGIPNAERLRPTEYTPYASSLVDEEIHGRPGGGDAYLDFLERVVKPLIDASFPTLPGPDTTGIIGSSLGGLISLYGFYARPDTFGFAGAMSPAIPASQMALIDLIRRGRVPRGRLYLDVGGNEGVGAPVAESAEALSQAFWVGVHRLHRLLVSTGYRDGDDLQFVADEQAPHSEAAWAARLPDALRFLVPH